MYIDFCLLLTKINKIKKIFIYFAEMLDFIQKMLYN